MGIDDSVVHPLPEIESALASRLEDIVRGAALDDGPSALEFAAHVTERVPAGEGTLSERATGMFLDDLYTAYACLRGVQGAVVRLARQLSEIKLAVGRVRVDADIAADAQQILLERLLVVPPGGGAPKIATYDGRGPLGAWLRVAWAREALYLQKRRSAGEQPEDTDQLLAFAVAERDPEVELLKREYHAKYRESFARAVSTLSSRERALLRQHLVLTMSIDEVGTIYGVHRATAARWINDAKEKLLRALLADLRSTLGVSADEARRIRQLIESRLDVSVHRLLRSSRG